MNRDKCKRALFLCVKYLVSAAVVAVVVGIHSCYLLAELNRNLRVYNALQTCFKQSASAEICA